MFVSVSVTVSCVCVCAWKYLKFKIRLGGICDSVVISNLALAGMLGKSDDRLNINAKGKYENSSLFDN